MFLEELLTVLDQHSHKRLTLTPSGHQRNSRPVENQSKALHW